MAQIRVVEKRSHLGWLWGLIGLVVVAALIWYFMLGGRVSTSGGDVAPSAPAPADSAQQKKDTVLRPHALEAMPVAAPWSAHRAAVREIYLSA
jgi:hypothetical protein